MVTAGADDTSKRYLCLQMNKVAVGSSIHPTPKRNESPQSRFSVNLRIESEYRGHGRFTFISCITLTRNGISYMFDHGASNATPILKMVQ